MSKIIVLVCQGTGCLSGGSDKVFSFFEQYLQDKDIILKKTGCHGFCQQGPLVVIEPEGVFYTKVQKEKDIKDIVNCIVRKKKYVQRLLYKDPVTEELIPFYREISFYKKQYRRVLHYCGKIDPEDISDYLQVGGYKAAEKALTKMKPEEIILEIKKSGLRGLGGAGFPTGIKWEICSLICDDTKYVICNADEGDPGAFQDRSIMEGNPHLVIEGMLIAAKAVGATKGYIYIRAEYPLAVKRLTIAIEQARREGFLGKRIFDTDFDFDIEIFQGAGAFVCGEETALIASVEGKRGMPRPRPPFPVHKGLWGKPTLINNVKTFANVPLIISNGADEFASVGTEKSKGTAIFSLTGKVSNCGLIEVPMGTTLRHIIFDIGGGVAEGKAFKAVQTGGPSGGCIPPEMLDLPVDFDSLTKAGSIMGSGGMVVMDEDTCMIDVAKYFVDFTQRESCGQCIPCRVGMNQMFKILEDITRGNGKKEDIQTLVDLGEAIKRASLCGLGKTAPNPVLTTIKYFYDEYLSHIEKRYCHAGVCGLK